ncbi:NAD(P)-binding protein [Laetiporus sulphureus 93-53]|uniref:NAD(P)-binding protein n=1 Tax=Laetiporus sulphureus 93-53 TaxID=1314785 RepID=A0A165DU66_9APHY|nr:NAD(P)-binding protein [Laetiporus sulphureus 93-53]KZT05640.1 NAD(P)-binding protein [Laetiporus sulphureus 93-53]
MGTQLSFLRPSRAWCFYVENFPPKPQWSTEQIPDLSGKVVIVTGANTGLGYESALALALHGAKVYVTARSKDKGLPAVETINSKVAAATEGPKSGQAAFLYMDLDDLQSVKAAADEFKAKESRLDILMNNAGVMMPPEGTKSKTGLEVQFAVNVLGPFVFTRLLLPILIHTAQTSESGTTRVITLGSFAHFGAPPGGVRLDKLDSGTLFERYAQSKLADMIYSKELAHRYTDSGIISISVSPGNIKTALWHHQTSFFTPNTFLTKYPVSMGILTQLYAATSPDITKADSGEYFRPWATKGQPVRDEADDPVLATKLWEWCEEQMKEAGISA